MNEKTIQLTVWTAVILSFAGAVLFPVILSLMSSESPAAPSESGGPVAVSAAGTAIMGANETQILIPVKIRNQVRYPISSARGFFVTYHLLDEKGALLGWDNVRSELPEIAPGKEITGPMKISRPAQPGEYLLAVDVVHERVEWMERLGSKVAMVKLRVESAAAR